VTRVIVIFGLALAAAALGQAYEPALPPGLSGAEPALPQGLNGAGPALPPGLGDDAPGAAARPRAAWDRPLTIGGFWEARSGWRVANDPHQREQSLGETRLQLDAEKHVAELTLSLKTDFVYDWIADTRAIDLRRGDGWIDLREANVQFTPFDFMDVKAGRQVLTWGTGDLIFINDLFPKDYVSFFIGRDDEYLKAPSDAVKLSLFSDAGNLDVVYVPRFNPDRFIDGRRISYYNPALGRRAGRDAVIDPQIPGGWFDDDEWHARVHRNIGPYELAAYGYWGYWKSPAGFDPMTGRATFPRLAVYGGSVRWPLGPGIANVELGYYDSLDDRGGGDPFTPNSQLRLLVGYERELVANLTLGTQYYLEYMLDHGAFRRSLPPGFRAVDRDRHVLTARLTWLTHSQNVRWSLFTFYSPSDGDAYVRPAVDYRIDDHWSAMAGGNVFVGRRRDTFFGQFARHSNVFVGLRYGF
jgi:hypothetical protein